MAQQACWSVQQPPLHFGPDARQYIGFDVPQEIAQLPLSSHFFDVMTVRGGHASWQLPFWQILPLRQVAPHEPQLLSSTIASTHW